MEGRRGIEGVLSGSPIEHRVKLCSCACSTLGGCFRMRTSPCRLPRKLRRVEFLRGEVPMGVVSMSCEGHGSVSKISSPRSVRETRGVVTRFKRFGLSPR